MSICRLSVLIRYRSVCIQLDILERKAHPRGDIVMMKRIEVFKEGGFSDKGMGKFLIHDSPYFRVINFNFKGGQELGIHSHDVDGQLNIVVL